MKRFSLVIFLVFAAAFRIFAQGMSDREVIDAISENKYRAGCGYSPYSTTEFLETPAPKGYKPFYVSNYSRHGSRYGGEGVADKCIARLVKLDSAGVLTPDGESLLQDLRYMNDAHKGNSGLLTGRGALEQQSIASRLYDRVPEVFNRKDARKLSCTSTVAQRAIVSMANFATAVSSRTSGLDVSYNVGFPDMPMFSPKGGTPERDRMKEEVKPIEDSLLAVFDSSCSIFDKICSDRKVGESIIGNLHAFSYDLLLQASKCGCLDIGIDPLGIFSPEEIFEFYKIRSLYYCTSYGYINPLSLERMHAADMMVRLMIKDADDALEGNGHCADLRFGHDSPVGPMQILFDLEGYINDVPMEDMYRFWPAWKNICMCTNVQLVFYRNRKSDVLVKVLVNEREARVNGLEAVDSVYYRWQDLRGHLLRRIGDSKELPASFEAPLLQKAARIRELQKNESDGFYFITDMHFPENCGNAAPSILFLQGHTAARKVFFGGDMAANRDSFEESLFPASCAFEQIRGGSRLYCLRGNHDCRTRTKPIGAPFETLPQWTTAEFMRTYISPDAVFDGDTGLYYYVDEPSAGIRYICLETTDRVMKNGYIMGMSDSQIQWIAEEAILGTPKGWSVIVLGHKPLVDSEAEECFVALNEHRSFELAGKVYDFSLRKDIKPLFVINGHRHRDVVSDELGFPQILTYADKNKGEAEGELEGQAFDYVSVSKDKKTITMVRIGNGKDRTIELK